ncbi:MAG: WD40-repeat-containing domain protein [Benniella sp.]|nr:MAG: WD40-repeat-containing domain protein [Benniella sp.]
MTRSTNSLSLDTLSLQQLLVLANICISNARKTKDLDVAQELCHDAETALSRIKKKSPATLASLKGTEDQSLCEGIATAYTDLGELQISLGRGDKAQANYKNAEQWRVSTSQKTEQHPQPKGSLPFSLNISTTSQSSLPLGNQQKQGDTIVHAPRKILFQNAQPPIIVVGLPEAQERLNSTPQLAYCIGLLQSQQSSDNSLDTVTRNWLQVTMDNTDEYERLKDLATGVIREFKRDEIKDAMTIAEVLHLVPVLEKDASRDLLRDFYTRIDQSDLLDVHQLEGLAQLIQDVKAGYLDADDLVKILELINERLSAAHGQSPNYIYQLTVTISHVLDAMADTNVSGLDREKLHAPLMSYLETLKKDSDPYLVYQAAYAYQALQYVPDNETPWGGAFRRTGSVIQAVSTLVSAVKGLDLNKFIDGLKNIQQGIEGVSGAFRIVDTAYNDATSLVGGGQDLLDSLNEGFSFARKREWYPALRGADVLIREGHFVKFEKLVYEAPCRGDPAFQWGVCQRLGEIAANDAWDTETRRSAVTFFGEIYQDDAIWRQPSVKQWSIKILMQLSSYTGSVAQYAATLLGELETNGDSRKRALYQAYREEGSGPYQLRFDKSTLANPTLLDRVQDKPDVETNLRQLRKRRINERGSTVYIPPQAKASLNASDESRFPLMDRVNKYLKSDQTVLLILGDSGSGKSTFNRSLEFDLWQAYIAKTGVIPLYINLPAIDKPEHDLVAKQLRKLDFTEPQIRELKYRQFILICDGYDESQQTRNLYTSNRLNEEGEWTAKMVISCRSEYVGHDYRDRFEPRDRNVRSDQKLLFDEAVITPFSDDQVQEYIKQYVVLYRPLWETENYSQALNLIPGLMDLVKNPFLLAMSLEVLPRMMDPDQQISAARITKVALYDQFIEQWLERGKKRVGEKNLSFQARSAFDSLCDEGFTMNAIDYLKKLAVAIYKEQGGQPVVEYSRLNDEGTWKADFFSRNEEKQLLREACPLVRNGNQYRFIHRSLLEYGLARTVFEPLDFKVPPEPTYSRRGSTNSVWSFELEGGIGEANSKAAKKRLVDPKSPLVWRNLVSETSILQFLSDRVVQEEIFKYQLLAYVESSKKGKRWRIAGTNAITILVKAGVQFVGADLQGIRIPGADLSYGVFDSAWLNDADLRKANLRGVWMRQADLRRAQMTGVQFGELPSLVSKGLLKSCAYSPDGGSIAVGHSKGDITVYTVPSWESIQKLIGHNDTVNSIAYSPRGDTAASASKDKTVRLWDAKTGACQHIITGHGDEVRSVAFSPQGDVVVSAGSDKTVRLWDFGTADCLQILIGHSEAVCAVAYSPQGNAVASAGYDGLVRLWNVVTGVGIRILSGHSDSITDIAYSPHGERLATASGKTIRLWDAEKGVCLRILTGHAGEVSSVVFSPQGDQLVSGSNDSTVRLWDTEAGSCRHVLTSQIDNVTCVAHSPHGDQIANVSGATVRLWDIPVGASSFVSRGHHAGVVSIKCSPCGNQFASCSGLERTIRLWDVETGTCYRTLSGHDKMVTCVAYSPDGGQIASASNDKTIRLWNLETGASQCISTGHSFVLRGVAYSPQGSTIASASFDKTVRLWNLGTRNCLGTLNGHKAVVSSVVFSPSGNQIATGSGDGTARLWDVGTQTCHHILRGHTSWVQCVAYSPQGDQLASASYDSTVRLWNVEAGECQLTLTGHWGNVLCVTYSVEGDKLASGSQDKTIRLWDVASGECLALTSNFHIGIYSIAWSATSDANYLIAGCGDGSVTKWQIIEDGDECYVFLCWCTTKGMLTLMGANIEGVQGLSPLNEQLLKQRQAVGEPEHL